MSFQEDFHVDWRIPAERVIQSVEEDPLIATHPEIRQLCSGFRRQIQAQGIDLSPIETWERTQAESRKALAKSLSSKDAAEFETAKAIEAVMEKTSAALRLLKEVYDFQLASYDTKYGEKTNGVSLAPLSEFLREHPQGCNEVTIQKRFEDFFGKDFRRIVAEMGFPVVEDPKDKIQSQGKVAQELWRIYNKKNGLDPSNRTYKPGTELPRTREFIYPYYSIEVAFGDFETAIQRVLFKQEETGEIKKEEVDDILWECAKTKKKSEVTSDQEKMVKDALVKEVRDLVKKVKGSRKSGEEKDPNFNWRFLTWGTKYIREFGVQIYDLWFTEEELKILTRDVNKVVQGQLEAFFLDRKMLKEMQNVPPHFEITEEEVDALSELSKTELMERLGKILEDDISEGTYLSKENILFVLRFFAKNKIGVAPKKTFFVKPQVGFAQTSMELLKAKTEFFKEQPEIPFYVRQGLYKANRTTVENIRSLMDYFASFGIPKEVYVHLLNTVGAENSRGMKQKAQKTKFSWEQYEKAMTVSEGKEDLSTLEKVKVLLRPYLDEAELDSLQEEDIKVSPGIVKRRIDKKKQRNLKVDLSVVGLEYKSIEANERAKTGVEENDRAKEELRRLGYPYEEMAPFIHRQASPRMVLKKVEYMLKIAGRVSVGHLIRSTKAIKRDMTGEKEFKVTVDAAQERLDSFLEERGWKAPPEYILRVSPDITLEKIAEIEARGVPFKEEYWWWLNAASHQRNRQIEHTWLAISREDRRRELAELYCEDPETVNRASICGVEPDYLWKFFQILKNAGQTIEGRLGIINGCPLAKVGTRLLDRLHAEEAKRELSGEEKKWMAREEKVRAFAAKTSEKYKGIAVISLCEEIKVEELDLDPEDILETLFARYVQKRKVLDKLRYYRFGYEDMEFWSADEEKQRFVLEQIDHLEKLKEKVTAEKLYEAYSDTHGASEDELPQEDYDDGLNSEQKIVFDYLSALGVYEPWARKLALRGENIEIMRLKVGMFQRAGANPELHGKTELDVEDFEEHLNEPIGYCKKRAVRLVKMKLVKTEAKKKLRKDLGIEWDHERGWMINRTAPETMLKKFKYVSANGALSKFAKENPDMVMRYTFQSLEELRPFIDQLRVKLLQAKVPTAKLGEYIEPFIRLFHFIVAQATKLVSSGTVRAEFVKDVKEAIFKEDNDFIKDWMEHVQSEMDWGKVATIAYRKILFAMKPLTGREDERTLWERKDAGDETAKEVLYYRYLHLVPLMARRYSSFGIPEEDLVQEGNMGLMKAIEKFEVERGVKFRTMADWWIRASITRYIGNNQRNVRLPGHIIEASRNYQKILKRFTEENRRNPKNISELATFEEISVEEIQRLKKAADLVRRREASLDAPVGDDEDSATLGELTGETDADLERVGSSKEGFWRKAKKLVFENFKKEESAQRAWLFFSLYYSLEDGEKLTLEEIGQKHHLTRERIRQIIEKVIEILKTDEGLMEELLSLQE